MNGRIDPEIERVVEWPTFIPLWGRQQRIDRFGEVDRHSRGSYPQHVVKGNFMNKGDPEEIRTESRAANKLTKQGCSEVPPGVGQADSTLRLGEPATWGSGLRRMNRSKET